VFGDIIRGKMVLNDFGEISWGSWNQIDKQYPNTNIHEFENTSSIIPKMDVRPFSY
tara:strand:+ start:12087 stop:12254 length:168 start_codon:yes stop_codon:yes gene_type:complete